MNYSSINLIILFTLTLFTFCRCGGSGKMHGETSGSFEMNSDYSYEETKNGEVVASKEAHDRKAGGFENEFDVEFGNEDDTTSKKELEAKVAAKKLNHQKNCTSSIDKNKFENIKAVIEDEFTDKSKLAVSKQLINDECLSSYQIANVMELMNMDKYRIEFAKFALGRITDKDNFRTVKETLSFASSKKKLESFYQRNQ